MKKLATLFTDSYREFRHVKTVTVAAMFGAVSVVLGIFTLVLGDYIKIGFSSLASQFVYYLFGPMVGGFYGAALDILKYLVKPTGAYFPGFTMGAMTAGVMYGCFFYKKPLTLARILTAELVVSIVCNVLLGTLWLSMLYGKGFFALLPLRVFKNLVMWPVNSFLFYTVAGMMESAGVFRILRNSSGQEMCG